MPKFYVQCGSVDLILATDSVESAAMAIIDRLLTPHLWVYDDEELTETDCHQHLMLEALLHLPTEISISEKGYDRDDAHRVSVPETITQWHKLMIGMRRLFALSGLDRTVAVLAGSHAIKQSVRSPQLPR